MRRRRRRDGRSPRLPARRRVRGSVDGCRDGSGGGCERLRGRRRRRRRRPLLLSLPQPRFFRRSSTRLLRFGGCRRSGRRRGDHGFGQTQRRFGLDGGLHRRVAFFAPHVEDGCGEACEGHGERRVAGSLPRGVRPLFFDQLFHESRSFRRFCRRPLLLLHSRALWRRPFLRRPGRRRDREQLAGKQRLEVARPPLRRGRRRHWRRRRNVCEGCGAVRISRNACRRRRSRRRPRRGCSRSGRRHLLPHHLPLLLPRGRRPRLRSCAGCGAPAGRRRRRGRRRAQRRLRQRARLRAAPSLRRRPRRCRHHRRRRRGRRRQWQRARGAPQVEGRDVVLGGQHCRRG
eukprot:Rhum_TRINITY_DN11956_c0_g1::Rhum_TRINITY_DN11956_c0_g1_i1::g.47932::m.47932